MWAERQKVVSQIKIKIFASHLHKGLNFLQNTLRSFKH